MWTFAGVRGTMGERVVDDLDRMPGARFFPDARLNFAENLLRRTDDRPAIIFNGENGTDAAVSAASSRCAVGRCAAALRAAASSPAIASPPSSRTCPRRSSRRSAPRRSAPSGRRARPTSACRACWIASGRSSPGCSSPPTATSTAGDARRAGEGRQVARRAPDRRDAIVIVPYVGESPRLDGVRGGVLWRSSSAPRARRAAVRAAPVQPSALHPVFVRHDRRAEVHRARRRRHADPAPQGASAALRHQGAAIASSTSRPAAG